MCIRDSLHKALLREFQPDLLVAMSSGATVVSALTDPELGLERYSGAVWMISAIKPNRLLRHAVHLPILFSHAYEDGLPIVEQMLPELSRAVLVGFDGDHGAAALLDGPGAAARVLDLVQQTMALCHAAPRAVQVATPSLFVGLPPRVD
eukprot:TRINITY_DN16538_c0_g1_i1.p1 TRINITY_DN16538_c0_g1~~TRINITY_DN16538_c0_g1_i1.p1  ORF type:complete len:149 (-),score=29.19 TRINITY_DN16538_c0_g1_i1:259-705(-)